MSSIVFQQRKRFAAEYGANGLVVPGDFRGGAVFSRCATAGCGSSQDVRLHDAFVAPATILLTGSRPR